ncbi:hypothetical protein [Streptomyces roseolus]|uniref:hypothetical protein n=1 Tax=Streptomyces roseolus TaxID=67358 RepID=UPI00167B51E4|nr:hypothetical protein [Streptomyces roseolus]GGR51944.1 hypothetical protein GCM10010282_51120 [Streptomyces roseolus]
MAVSHVNTQVGSSASSTSVVVTKPTGTASGDLLTAFVTSNYQAVTPPAGWTEIGDYGIETFRVHVFRKVASGSEGSSYTFTVPSSATLLCQATAWRGVDNTTPIDITPVLSASFNSSEPMDTEAVSGGTQGRLVYFRAARRASSGTPITYTASGVTELSDSGVAASGNAFAYSGGLYMATSDYASGGSKAGLAITASTTETHNVTVTMAIKAGGTSGTVDVDLPAISSVSMSGSVAYPATLDADLPMPTMEGEAFHGFYEGPLSVEVPIAVDIAGRTPPRGPLEISLPPIVEIVGETRRFAENVVNVDRGERWFVMTQDGWYLGRRNVRFVPLVVELSLPVVLISATTAPEAPSPDVLVEAFGASVTTTFSAGAASASGAASAIAMENGALGVSESIDVGGSAEDAVIDSLSTLFVNAELAEVQVEVPDVTNVDASAGLASVTVATNAATVTTGGGIQPNAGHAAVSVAANAPTVTKVPGVRPTAGHASVACHN